MPALDGMRVLDLTQYEAGTSGTQLLAFLGADVVKVEPPGRGDPGRHTEADIGDSIYFLSFNGNKRSLTLDLSSEEGRRLFLELLPHFDVVAENFSLGTMDRLGLGYETLKALHPPIIYATIKGFGLEGPYAAYKCYDMVAQAAGGAWSVTGMPDGVPMRSGPSIADTSSGMSMALGIVAAYVQRLRTGEGQLIEISMQETVFNLMRTRLSQRERTGDPAPRRGNRIIPPSDVYPCAPGGSNDYICMHVVTSRMYDALTIGMDRPELASDPRFATQQDRAKNGDALWEEVAAWTRQRTKHEAMQILAAAGVPCSAIFDSGDLFRDPHLRQRGMIKTMHHPERGDWELPAFPIRMTRSNVELQASPLLGQHTAEVLCQELGLDAAQIDSLQQQGVV